MSLGTGQNKVQYDVNASQSVFSFPWKFWDESDLVIVVQDKTTSVETVLSIGTDYTVVYVNGDPENGATITLVTALDNHIVTISREIPIQSEADYTIGDGIPPDTLNESFDKAAAASQQLEALVTRQIQFPISDPAGLNYELLAVNLRANKAILFDANGNLIVGDLVSAGSLIIDATKGLDDTALILSVKADNAIFEFDVGGSLTLLDEGIAWSKIAPLADGQFLGRRTGGGAGTPFAYDILGYILEDNDFLDANPTIHGATQANIKTYIENNKFVRKRGLVKTDVKTYDAANPNFTKDNAVAPQATQGLLVAGINYLPVAGTANRSIMIRAWCNWGCDTINRVMCLFDTTEGPDAKAVSFMEHTINQNLYQTLDYSLTNDVGGTPNTNLKTFELRVGGAGPLAGEGTSKVTINGEGDDLPVFSGGMTSGVEIIEYNNE